MTLHQLSDELLEIRRYVRSNPDYVRERLGSRSRDLDIDQECIMHVPERDWLRINANILVGLSRIVVDPEVLEGYLYGAAAEIRALALREEDDK